MSTNYNMKKWKLKIKTAKNTRLEKKGCKRLKCLQISTWSMKIKNEVKNTRLEKIKAINVWNVYKFQHEKWKAEKWKMKNEKMRNEKMKK